MSNNSAWDFDEAREAARNSSSNQLATENFVKEAYKTFAKAEEAYRVALAKQIIHEHDAGRAWTVCGDLARGEKNVARLKMERDIAEGVKEAASQAGWRRSADRRDTERFVEWSMRRDLAEGYRAPNGEGKTFGGVRA